VDIWSSHRSAVRIVAEFFGTPPRHVRAAQTWGPTIVLEIQVEPQLTVFIKAGANQNVHTEAAVASLARSAGVPTVDVLGRGTDNSLPGGRWTITRAATGCTLADVGFQTETTAKTMDGVAECYSRLHRLSLPGFGPIAENAQRGTLRSWSQWQRQTMDAALDQLMRGEPLPAGFAPRARDLSVAFADDLDRAPAALLHTDLGDQETFVDPATGAVTAIVDWGSALVGDPLYDIARFVGGGPADDLRTIMIMPSGCLRSTAFTCASWKRHGAKAWAGGRVCSTGPDVC
jgi:aminoglycoside phosphotransferase (APT) family kinase protein